MLDRLPPELCLQVIQKLSAKDVLKVLILHRSLTPLGNSELLWKNLMKRDSSGDNEPTLMSEQHLTARELKRAYLVYAHSLLLESVRWRPLRTARGTPSAREGHLMCILGPPSNKRVILTGGFSDDHQVHILPLNSTPNEQEQQWISTTPRGILSFVYGASLTPFNETSAIRFGGFRAGGYSGETNQVCLMRLNNENQVDWQVVETNGTAPMARAYHSATLVENRYLVIIGGMTTRGSILQEAILDTQTWTWLDKSVSTVATSGKPSGRHGHSVVLDSKRNRLVLFGGGSGSDLLRSGADNTEVWELMVNSDGGDDLAASLPWTWNKIYKDSNEEDNGELPSTGKASGLSPAECLVLGRCHVGAKVSVDTVVLAFGSGTPTTNGVLVYNLATDKFQRPDIRGPLPVPRFTAAAVVMDSEGFLLIHGGYTTQVDGTRGDVALLDLAPGIRRDFPYLRVTPDSDNEVMTYRRIHDGDAERARQRHQDNDIGDMLVRLSDTNPDERRALANRLLVDMINGGGMGGHAALILNMVANGNVRFGEDDDSDDDEDLGDEDFEDDEEENEDTE